MRFACLPLDRPDHSGFLLLVIQPSIHLDIHPIPSRPFMHSGILPSMHPFALPHFSFNSSIPMRPNRLVASVCSTHPNASCENVPSIRPCPILRASIHRAVYVNHPPSWFVLLYPGKRRPSIKSREARQSWKVLLLRTSSFYWFKEVSVCLNGWLPGSTQSVLLEGTRPAACSVSDGAGLGALLATGL